MTPLCQRRPVVWTARLARSDRQKAGIVAAALNQSVTSAVDGAPLWNQRARRPLHQTDYRGLRIRKPRAAGLLPLVAVLEAFLHLARRVLRGVSDLAPELRRAVADVLADLSHAAAELDDTRLHVVTRLLGVALDAVVLLGRRRRGDRREQRGASAGRDQGSHTTGWAHGCLLRCREIYDASQRHAAGITRRAGTLSRA